TGYAPTTSKLRKNPDVIENYLKHSATSIPLFLHSFSFSIDNEALFFLSFFRDLKTQCLLVVRVF
ncbi:MAG: hypothetical protein ABF728_08180, partial [Bifidobacterium aquikefiri]